eukprot:scaffold24383_cov39-Cyclotella_meneghiniana.AAC.4
MSHFHNQMKCHARDSGVLVSQFINSSAVRCFLPRSYNDNIVPLSLVLADRIVSNVENFIAVDLRVNSMHPTFGSVKGNTPVSFALDKRSMDAWFLFTLWLRNWRKGGKADWRNLVNSSSLACHFDETKADCQFKSEEEITCVSPKLKRENYSIGVDVIDTSLQYQVRLQMTTVFARPSFASITGGATIQVFGTNFQRDDALECRFGNSATPAFYIGPNVIECTTPSHKVSVVVEL